MVKEINLYFSDFVLLQTMMEDLQKCYVTCDDSSLETVSEGMLYAGKFNNDWYRCDLASISIILQLRKGRIF